MEEEMEDDERIGFKHLSRALKTLVVLCWAMSGFFVCLLAFMTLWVVIYLQTVVTYLGAY